MAEFDPTNPKAVKELQQKLNEFARLSATKDEKPFQLTETGKLDPATLAMWKKFKQESYVDSRLSASYLKERFNITAPEGMNPQNPPADIVKAVQAELGLEQNGKLADPATNAAITKDKSANWTDDRINDGALAKLDGEITSRKAAQGMSTGTMVMGALAVAGAAGVAYVAYSNANPKTTPSR